MDEKQKTGCPRAGGADAFAQRGERFQEGEFRKRVQFMFGGELKTVKFRYKGLSVESVLDRLPTAKVLSHSKTNGYLITAEVYGDGIDMWLRSQGENIELIQ